MIKNPEVPGLEQNFLPQPQFPPLPIIPTIETKVEKDVQISSAPISISAPIYVSSSSTSTPTSQPVPWWVPTDADTQEPYSQWIEHQQEQTIVASSLEKTTFKSLKRKCESIDPVQNAERVECAQRELAALMKPLKCDLCNAVMNSTLQAKLHYDGKPHQKKVLIFLNQSVKKLKTDEKAITNVTANGWSTYCEVCKTWFTSQIDAAQHYAGKKHIRATTGLPRQKSPKKKSNQTLTDPTGTFGIGLTFQSEHQVNTKIDQLTAPFSASSSSAIGGFAPGATNYGTALRCDLCGVSANRLEQLETHRRGARHQKMLRLNGVTNSTSASPQIDCTSSAAKTIDYSICRTPSGSYYCAACNKSFNSENSFAQHIESRKHKNQINPKSPTNQTSSDAKKKDKTKSIHQHLRAI